MVWWVGRCKVRRGSQYPLSATKDNQEGSLEIPFLSEEDEEDEDETKKERNQRSGRGGGGSNPSKQASKQAPSRTDLGEGHIQGLRNPARTGRSLWLDSRQGAAAEGAQRQPHWVRLKTGGRQPGKKLFARPHSHWSCCRGGGEGFGLAGCGRMGASEGSWPAHAALNST